MFTRSRPEPARFDPFLHDAGLRRPYQLLFSGAWEELDHAFETDPGSWMATSILVSDAAIETDVFQFYVDAGPSPYALSLLGGAQLRDIPAVAGNGAGHPQRQTREQVMKQVLAAERPLHAAIRLDPLLADPWVHLVTSGRRLRVNLRELRERFENASSRAPFRQDACREYLLGLNGRGGKGNEAMFDFVRWLLDVAPAGSGATLALPMAHLEHGLRGPTGISLDDHLALPATIAQVTEALAHYLEFAPSPIGPAELATLNAFALATTVHDRSSALLVQDCYARIDNRPTSYPWSSLPAGDANVPAVFCRHQRLQLEAASRFADE